MRTFVDNDNASRDRWVSDLLALNANVLPMPRTKGHVHPQPLRYFAGVGVVLVALSVYSGNWSGARAALRIDMQRFMSSIVPPKGATVTIDVPFHKQEHGLSCEIASLRSALLAVGLNVPESMLISGLTFDETPKRVVDKAGNFTWGDPDEGFVGDIDGRMPSTGYGIHAKGLAKLASLYVVASDIKVNDAAALTAAIDAKHPVIAWSTLGTPSKFNWTTPEGKKINGALYEHTVVVSGYKGTPGHIDKVYLVDPRTGKREESWEEFTRRTSFLGHQGLEIQPVTFW